MDELASLAINSGGREEVSAFGCAETIVPSLTKKLLKYMMPILPRARKAPLMVLRRIEVLEKYLCVRKFNPSKSLNYNKTDTRPSTDPARDMLMNL
jgi:hypothetical protein